MKSIYSVSDLFKAALVVVGGCLAWTIIFLVIVFSVAWLSSGLAHATDWNRPGHNPFLLPVPDAIESYPELPFEVRRELWRKLETRRPTDIAVITREAIVGQGGQRYGNLRDMHWGAQPQPHRGPVNRSTWKDGDEQRGFIYCSGDWCVIVPFICRNLALVDRLEAAGGGGTAPTAVATSYPVLAPLAAPLEDGATFLESSEPEVAAIAGGPPIYLTQWLPGIDRPVPFLVPYAVPVDRPVEGWDRPGTSVVGVPEGSGVPVSPVPEPETYALMAAGLAALVLVKRRAKA